MKEHVQRYVELLQTFVDAADNIHTPLDAEQQMFFIQGKVAGSGEVAKLMIEFLKGIE